MCEQIDVFVSHNRKSKPWVRQFVSQLRAQGLSVFFDEDSITPGSNVVRALDSALDRARHTVLVITPAALESDWVAMESTAASYNDPAGRRRTLIPLILEEGPTDALPTSVRVLNAVSLCNPTTRVQQYRLLLSAIGISESAASRLSPPDPDWSGSEEGASGVAELPPESVYVRKRTRDLIMSFFPASLCDLSSLWIRHDLSFSALVQRAEIYHPRCHEDIVAALATARGAAYDAKYAAMEGYDDERSLDPDSWEAEFYQVLRGLGMENTSNLFLINVGIGNGREWTSFYSSCRRILGVDVSRAALESAAGMHKKLETVQADAGDLSCIDSGRFDIYISLRTDQSTLFDVERSVLEATRILKPGGMFIVSLSDAHRVGTGIVRGILEPDSHQVDFDHPYLLAENVRRVLTSLGFSRIGVRTGHFEVYVFGRRPG